MINLPEFQINRSRKYFKLNKITFTQNTIPKQLQLIFKYQTFFNNIQVINLNHKLIFCHSIDLLITNRYYEGNFYSVTANYNYCTGLWKDYGSWPINTAKVKKK